MITWSLIYDLRSNFYYHCPELLFFYFLVDSLKVLFYLIRLLRPTNSTICDLNYLDYVKGLTWEKGNYEPLTFGLIGSNTKSAGPIADTLNNIYIKNMYYILYKKNTSIAIPCINYCLPSFTHEVWETVCKWGYFQPLIYIHEEVLNHSFLFFFFLASNSWFESSIFFIDLINTKIFNFIF